MKAKTVLILSMTVLLLGLSLAQAQGQAAIGTAFTYQGQLTDGGVPANGTYDLQFTLYDAPSGGNQVGSAVTREDVTVTNGLFTVQLDFGAVFDGTALYLEVAVRPGGSSGAYTALSPRQALTAVPNAVYAAQAPWSGLSGVPAGFSDGVDDDALGGLACSNGQVPQWNGSAWVCAGGGWSLAGNSGTAPGTDFLGTTDNKALELKVNSARALRLEPNATSPNLIGGHSENQAWAGVVGATIGGGGEGGYGNLVTDSYGTIGGGADNQAGDYHGTTDDAGYATVAGGRDNSAYNAYSTVGGGAGNQASHAVATIGGGSNNYAGGVGTTIGGGVANDAGGYVATIGGGWGNVASGNYATVPGGVQAAATQHGQLAYASGGFGSEGGPEYGGEPGSAQTSVYVLRNSTFSNVYSKHLFLDGSGQAIAIDPGRTVVFDILIVARERDNGQSAGYEVHGVIENDNGTTRLLPPASVTVLAEEDPDWYVGVYADDHTDTLRIVVQGNVNDTIRWVATVRTVEVQW